MPMYEITISKSFANQGKDFRKKKKLQMDPFCIRKWYAIFYPKERIHKLYCHYFVHKD